VILALSDLLTVQIKFSACNTCSDKCVTMSDVLPAGSLGVTVAV